MRNISISEYLKRKDYLKYSFILDSLNSKDHLHFDLNKLSYNDVIKCNRIIAKPKDINDVKNLFKIAYRIKDDRFFELPIINFFQSKKYLIEKFVYLRENEAKLLSSSEIDAMYFESAGGKRLNDFSDVLPLDRLAKIYGGSPLDYGDKKYVEVLYLLRMNKVLHEVDKRFSELKYNK